MAPKNVHTKKNTHYTGTKKGLVILTEFTDKRFLEKHDRQKYNDILNASGYTTGEGFIGSVADYFRDQSNGLFDLEFDVVGPFTTKNNYSYYGKNNSDGDDLYPEKMVTEMCMAADSIVNFADYDWNGDGEVDEVFILYAGKGEADTGIANYIWPHMWSLEDATGSPIFLDGVKINIYACSNELTSSGKICGIGTFCHEFSHCLGLPDFYDITYSGLFGMGEFDLMSGGTYNGNGFCPPCYTAYEKMACGWQDPIVLSDEDMTVDSLKPISENGDTYIIYNDNHPDEFYMIENRQKTGWDKSYPAKGLMITHVDFDQDVWFNNIPNSVLTLEEAFNLGYTCKNDHQRMIIFHADNDDDSKYWNNYGYYLKSTLTTDLYPYKTNDSLTIISKPVATLFHNNSEGTKLMQGAVLDITQNNDRTMSFRYRAKTPDAVASVQPTSNGLPTSDNGLQATGIYDLLGRKLSGKPSKHGVYIVDGKKVVR